MSQSAQKAATQSILRRYVNKETMKYVFTTHFWGPVSNFGIPLAAIYDLKKDPEMISGPMTGALIMYSAVFMKFALTVQPRNFLLFGCHVVNEFAQTGQAFRFVNYHYLGGNENKVKEAATSAVAKPE
ncbi:LANO_0E04522g1_1 [Lachancea nothofagi CBS 11611]|uniref:Mitochondrial pyruvate carrier n=1 Tax=Lachancea nothofagi CBS 11611 TaxID=1266666 RepID=A0A1G4JS68_9SACH|nr:LANO_0E04522g1_1 [Lachancea nothofagi CBS 11611]